MAANASNSDTTPGGENPVDFAWLRECTDNDTETMKTMLDLYFNRTATLLGELDGAIAANSAADVRRIAHACLGSSGACGMTRLSALFKELEKRGAAGVLDGTAPLAAETRIEFGKAKEFVSRTMPA